VPIGKVSSIAARHYVPTYFVGDFLVRFVCDVVEKHYDGRTPIKEINYTPTIPKLITFTLLGFSRTIFFGIIEHVRPRITWDKEGKDGRERQIQYVLYQTIHVQISQFRVLSFAKCINPNHGNIFTPKELLYAIPFPAGKFEGHAAI